MASCSISAMASGVHGVPSGDCSVYSMHSVIGSVAAAVCGSLMMQYTRNAVARAMSMRRRMSSPFCSILCLVVLYLEVKVANGAHLWVVEVVCRGRVGPLNLLGLPFHSHGFLVCRCMYIVVAWALRVNLRRSVEVDG